MVVDLIEVVMVVVVVEVSGVNVDDLIVVPRDTSSSSFPLRG